MGYYHLHTNPQLNFTLNRLLTYGNSRAHLVMKP